MPPHSTTPTQPRFVLMLPMLLSACLVLLHASAAHAAPAANISPDIQRYLPQSLSHPRDNTDNNRATKPAQNPWQLRLGINTEPSLKSPALLDAERKPWLRHSNQAPSNTLNSNSLPPSPDSQQLDLRLSQQSNTRFLGGNINPELGGRIQLDGSSQELYLGARWTLTPQSPLSLSLGLAALRDRQRYQELDPNSRDDQNTLLRLPIEARYRFNSGHSASLRYDRLSTDPRDPKHSTDQQLELRYGIQY